MTDPAAVQLTRWPRVLFISAWDGEDYGVQYLYDGLCDLMGVHNVVEWPFNPYHHRSPLEGRQYDSELSWPRQHWDECEIVQMLRTGQIDVLILSSVRPQALATLFAIAPWIGSVGGGLILCDMEDTPQISAAEFLARVDASIRQHVRVICKRELRMGETPVCDIPIHPLPFAYPRSRAIAPWQKPGSGPVVFYRAHDWGWPDGSSRHRLVQALREKFGASADVGLSREQRESGQPPPNRLSNAEYHQRLAAARIGIALNDGGGSDNNRYWETVAHGCVLVSDRPRHCIPADFIDGQEACYYSTVEEAVALIEKLATDPARCDQIARAGFEKFLTCHTTGARAAQLLHIVAMRCVQLGIRPDWFTAPRRGEAA